MRLPRGNTQRFQAVCGCLLKLCSFRWHSSLGFTLRVTGPVELACQPTGSRSLVLFSGGRNTASQTFALPAQMRRLRGKADTGTYVCCSSCRVNLQVLGRLKRAQPERGAGSRLMQGGCKLVPAADLFSMRPSKPRKERAMSVV